MFMRAIDFLMVHFFGPFSKDSHKELRETALDGFMGSNYCEIYIPSFAFYDRKCTATSKKKKNWLREPSQQFILHF